MLTLYFSGTGNTKFVAGRFSELTGADCRSIEESPDFTAQISEHDVIAFCYPVYGSRPPRIMADFAVRHADALKGKRLVILCTQWLFSGDGARSFTDLFPKGHAEVICAEHFFMPNNINNLAILPKASGRSVERRFENTRKKVEKTCAGIESGAGVKRGFNAFSRLLGLTQGSWTPIASKNRDVVKIGAECNGCGLCVSGCPEHNLELSGGKAVPKGACTFCYRCINKCPRRAVRLCFNRRATWRYEGRGHG